MKLSGSCTKETSPQMSLIKIQPGCYVINNSAIIEITPSSGNSSEITLLYSSPVARRLFESGTKITKSNQQLAKLMSGLDYELIDSTRAEIIAELYG